MNREIGLIAHPNLVAYGGPDGVGKDFILKRALAKLGRGKVTVVDPDPLKKLYPGQEAIARRIDARPTSYMFARGYSLALPVIEQALNSGEVVLVKRPFNFLMHAYRTNSPHAFYLEKVIASGLATNRLWPTVWMEITGTAEDIVENLKGREAEGVNTSSDPTPNLEQVGRYLRAQQQALDFVKQVQVAGDIQFVEIPNPRVKQEEMDRALQSLALQVIKYLPLRS